MSIGYYDNDAVHTLTQDVAGTSTRTTYTLDAAGRRLTAATGPVGGTATSTIKRHYTDSSDNPAYVTTETVAETTTTTITRYAGSLGGDLAATITAGAVDLPLANPHGDTVATVEVPATGPATGIAAWSDYDEYGNPLNEDAAADVGGPTGYSWLGAKERATDDTGLVLMGARLYNPLTGQFTSLDPVHGGNETAYSYPGDPINVYDLSGECPACVIGGLLAGAKACSKFCGKLKKVFKKTKKSAPRPFRRKSNARGGSSISCDTAPVGLGIFLPGNSFTSDTPVLMSDGTHKPISEVQVGDMVQATIAETGETEARPVIALIRHDGDHTMVDITLENGSVITATDRHPFWNDTTRTYTDAIDLRPGDDLLTDDADQVRIRSLRSYPRDLTAYNLTVGGMHTFYAVAGRTPVLVHNDGDAGKNDPHGDGGRRAASLQKQIENYEERLKNPNLSRKQKVALNVKIKNMRKEAAAAAKGETHGRRGKGC